MERSRRLYELWNWFVPFRVAAETESLAEASKALHVAPSAISRSIKLLEERLALSLFDRRPGQLKLNARGRQMLSRVRVAMRTLDDGIEEVVDNRCVLPLTLAASGELLPALRSALAALARQASLIQVLDLTDEQALAGLRQGRVDLAVVGDAVTADELCFDELAELERAVFVSPDHPAAHAQDVSVDDLHFVVVRKNGVIEDGFPSWVRRNVSAHVGQGAGLLEMLAGGWLAASLPRITGRRAGLEEIDLGLTLAPARLVVARRTPLIEGGPSGDEVVELLRSAFTQA